MKAQLAWRCLSSRQAAAAVGTGRRCAATRHVAGRCCRSRRRKADRRGTATCPAAAAAVGRQAAVLPVSRCLFLFFYFLIFDFFSFYFFIYFLKKNFTLKLKRKKQILREKQLVLVIVSTLLVLTFFV